MGDFFERIVDLEATEEEAGPLAERMVGRLVAEGVLIRERSREGVYSAGADEGYLPGPGWGRAVHGGAEAGWAPGPVAVVLGRRDHIAGQGEYAAEAVTCPRCGTRTVVIDYPEVPEPDDEVWRPFEEAVAVWRRTGGGSVPCPACGVSVPVAEWDFGEDFALGALAFEFWNWPPLDDGFRAEFGRWLGHRTAHHTGKF
ncbi:hypothetical protein [Streptomyces glaucosporus]